jgi:lysophospholipase L1-like esterase
MTRRRPPLALGILGLLALAADQEAKPRPFEKEIQAFEKADRENPPKEGGIVFVGSSSIRLWKTQEAFPDLQTTNRGFGGSQMADSVFYAPRIVLPSKPRRVVVFAGGNDIHSGKTPEQVAEDFRALVGKIHEALPKTRIYFISLFPNVARASEDEKCKAVNGLIRAIAERDPRLGYIDVRPKMESPEGKARPELLRADGLHLNDQGYKIWNEAVGPILRAPDPK